MTRRVGKHEQGELQGAINLLRSAGTMIGPAIFTATFAYSVSTSHAWKAPSIAWFLGGALLVIAAMVAWRATSPRDDVRETVDRVAVMEEALIADTPVAE